MLISTFSKSMAFRIDGKIAVILKAVLPKACGCSESAAVRFNEFYLKIFDKLSSLIQGALPSVETHFSIPIVITLECAAVQNTYKNIEVKGKKKREIFLIEGKVKIKKRGVIKNFCWQDCFDELNGVFLNISSQNITKQRKYTITNP